LKRGSLLAPSNATACRIKKPPVKPEALFI